MVSFKEIEEDGSCKKESGEFGDEGFLKKKKKKKRAEKEARKRRRKSRRRE